MQSLLDIEPARAREAQVQHQAGGNVFERFVEKRRRRREASRGQARGPHQSRKRVENRGIVVDDVNSLFAPD
jgi:hypothetical protein